MITIALSKGRILTETLPILNKAGILLDQTLLNSRRLILDDLHNNIKIIILRPSDVPVFVRHGAADLGIAGKDVLLEKDSGGIYELVDLGISKCRLMVAAPSERHLEKQTLKVATKYTNLTARYFNAKAQQIELIKLYGAMELAPIVGLADCIVDLVDSGNTLKANGLKPLRHIADISTRLIVNSAAYISKNKAIKQLVEKIQHYDQTV